MNWQKNRFSYFLWLVYTIVVGIGVLGIASIVCTRLGYISDYGLLTGGAYLVCVGVLVVCLRKLLVKKNFAVLPEGMPALVAENIIVLALFVVGIVMRVMYISNMSGLEENNYFFELAKVAEGQSVPLNAHGATYWYACLLHGVLFLFGNKMSAAVWLQILLQFVATVFLYLGVRKLAGRLAAVIFAGFVMCTPYMVEQAVVLSPTVLFLVVYGLVLCCIALNLQYQEGKFWNHLFVGIAIGICCYMDVLGITLLILAAGILSLERDETKSIYNKSGMVLLYYVLGSILGVAVLVVVNSVCSGCSILNIFNAFGIMYRSEGLLLPTSLYQLFQRTEGMLLVAVLGLGIFCYGRREDYERQSIWQSATIVLLIFCCFQMTHPHVDGVVCVYILLAALAGVGIEGIFVMDNATRHFVDELEEKLAKEETQKAKAVLTEKKEEVSKVAAQKDKTEENAMAKAAEANGSSESKGVHIGEITVENLDETQEENGMKLGEITVENLDETSSGAEKPKVKLLENPLPGPKKHVPKVMDYKVRELDLKNTYEFDIDVSDDDDFDI